MSAPKAREQLEAILSTEGPLAGAYIKANDILTSDYRKVLDNSRVHIIDLSKDALAPNLHQVPNATKEELDISIETLWKVLRSNAKTVLLKDVAAELPQVITSEEQRPVFVDSHKLLVFKSFQAARRFITNRISKSSELHTDKFFGIVDRTRTRAEYEAAGYRLEPAVSPATGKPVEGWYLYSPSGRKRKGIRYFNKLDQEILDPDSKELKLRRRSALDIGHNYMGKDSPEAESVISYKLNAVYSVLPEDSPARKVISDALDSLLTLTPSIKFKFKNTVPESKGDTNVINAGYLVVGLEFYTLNGQKAKVESSVYSAARSAVYKEVLALLRKTNATATVAGSNTQEQDLVELVSNKILSELPGKATTKPIKKHSEVTGAKSGTSKARKAPLKTSSTPLVLSRTIRQLRNLQGQFYSIARLQLLLNANLAQKIKENMGDGSRRDILNLRSGRFAESARVERLSQSREGMITAFYSYMKNPYQTFEPGFRQGSPNSRNPRLLISKSIREIAATQVANRMRSVLI